MILHLLTDEKVCPRTIRLFEECNACGNIFVVFNGVKEKWSFVSKANNIISCHSSEVKHLNWGSIDKVIIHYLDPQKMAFVLSHPLKDKMIIWMMWGGDIYNKYLYKLGFKLYASGNSSLHINEFKNKSFKCLRKLKQSLLSPYYFYLQKWFMENRIDYIVTDDVQLELIKKYIGFKRLKSNLQFSYYPIEDVLGELKECRAEGNKILIGNSCSFSNNHEYVLEKIENLDFSTYEVVVPLNYGVNEEYRDIVAGKYRTILQATILEDFLPLDEYNRLMLQTNTCIYGNFRQEAWGNILIGLYLGSKIYLTDQNPLLEQCKRYGFVVFELEDIQRTFTDILSYDDKERNRKLALVMFSSKKNKEYIQTICKL